VTLLIAGSSPVSGLWMMHDCLKAVRIRRSDIKERFVGENPAIYFLKKKEIYACVAQLVEQWICNP
jgi:hypothetical protein